MTHEQRIEAVGTLNMDDLTEYKLENGDVLPVMRHDYNVLCVLPTLADFLRHAVTEQFGRNDLDITIIASLPKPTN